MYFTLGSAFNIILIDELSIKNMISKSIKDSKKDLIMNVSKELFLSNGINNVFIKDISLRCNLGEATIYRYYNKKENIIILSAISLQKEILENYFRINDSLNGITSLKHYFNAYLNIFKEHKNYYNFLRELDVYILNNNVNNLITYEKGIDSFKEIFMNIFNKGIKDNTIKEIEDIDTYFYSSSHALIGLCEKLSIDKAIIKQDENQDKVKEIELLINSYINLVSK